MAGGDWLKEESFSLSPESLSSQQNTHTHKNPCQRECVLGVVLIRNFHSHFSINEYEMSDIKTTSTPAESVSYALSLSIYSLLPPFRLVP